MTWEDLQKQAAEICKNVPTGEYEDISFPGGTSGSPTNNIGLPEIHRWDEPLYSTVRNGTAHKGAAVIRCRKTGAYDKNDRFIYECENGQLFVYIFRRGSASSFSSGRFANPEIS